MSVLLASLYYRNSGKKRAFPEKDPFDLQHISCYDKEKRKMG